MKQTLIYSDEKSSKFWSIEKSDNTLIITFGKSGTSGQTQIKEFSSDTEVNKQFDKLIAEKLKKGYVAQSELDKNFSTNENHQAYQGLDIVVDISSVSSMKNALEIMLSNKQFKTSAAQFGDILDEDFFESASKHKELKPLLEKYIKYVDANTFIDTQSDVRLGMNAAYYLALEGDEYIPNFIDLHRRIRPGGGESQMDHIIDLLSNTDNGLKLLAACAVYQIDQPDIEYNLELWIEEHLTDAKKETTFFKYLMQEAAKIKDKEFLEDYITEVLNIMGIEYDEDVLHETLEELTPKKIPTLNSISLGRTEKQPEQQTVETKKDIDIESLVTIDSWNMSSIGAIIRYCLDMGGNFNLLAHKNIQKYIKEEEALNTFLNYTFQMISNKQYDRITYINTVINLVMQITSHFPNYTTEDIVKAILQINTIPNCERIRNILNPKKTEPLTGKPFYIVLSNLKILIPADFTINDMNTVELTNINGVDCYVVKEGTRAKQTSVSNGKFEIWITFWNQTVKKASQTLGNMLIHEVDFFENLSDTFPSPIAKKFIASKWDSRYSPDCRKCIAVLDCKGGSVTFIAELYQDYKEDFFEIIKTAELMKQNN